MKKRVFITILLSVLLLSGCAEKKQEDDMNPQPEPSDVIDIVESYQYAGVVSEPIVIDTEKEVELYLDEAEFEIAQGAAITVNNAKLLTIHLKGMTSATLKDAFLRANCPVVIDGDGEVHLSGDDTLFDVKDLTLSCQGVHIRSKANVINAQTLKITAGNLVITNGNDGIHAVNFYQEGGAVQINVKDDAIHCEELIRISGGDMSLVAHEGLEARNVEVSDGNLLIVADDDGINATDNGSINISGGMIKVMSLNDGIDSNGNIILSGGMLMIYSVGQDEAEIMDFETESVIRGGTFIGLGSSSSRSFVRVENQQLLTVDYPFKQNEEISIRKNSEEIFAFRLEADVSRLFFSSEAVQSGSIYEIYMGDTPVRTIEIAAPQSHTVSE